AWRLFSAGDFPLVLTDWLMPEMDGLELIRRIRASERPGYVYVILLTACSDKADVVQGIEAGGNARVRETVDREEVRVRGGCGGGGCGPASGSSTWSTRWPSRTASCARRRPPSTRARSWPAWASSPPAWLMRSTTRSPTSRTT